MHHDCAEAPAVDAEPDSRLEAPPVARPRGSGLASSFERAKLEQLASKQARREFEAIVAPLELASGGRRLGGPGLELCLAAFDENPHGFRLCAEEALRRGTESKLGLLVRMVADLDHRGVLPPSAPGAPTFEDAERWVRESGWHYEPIDFADEFAQRFPAVADDELARQRLDRLYDELRREAGSF